MNERSLRRFINLSAITLLFVYLVIIAGAVVRATGSGMGCPDWPKCFGKWIPPTDVSQLPADYKEVYAGEHHAVAEFNALNTWTEYINRLCGATLGVLIFFQLLSAIKFRKTDRKILVLSFIEFILIGFQGWLGAKVVSSNLAPVKITVHMVVALIILSLAVAVIHRARKINAPALKEQVPSTIRTFIIIAIFLTIVQVMLGTQIREEVDLLLKNFDAIFRGDIVNHLGTSFIIHRSFSIVVVVVNIWMVYRILKVSSDTRIRKYSKLLAACLILEFLVGAVLSRFALPAPLQPVHLLLGCIIYALQFSLLLQTRPEK